MGEIVSSVILGLMSVFTAVVTTAGLSRPARIRHELRDVTLSLTHLQPDTPAYRALARVIEIRSADLAALQLVKYDGFLLGLSAMLIVGGAGAAVVGREVLAAVVGGWIAVALGYAIAFSHVPKVNRLRRRQARAIIAGRPSGLVKIDASVPLRRSGVRHEVYHPEEYPMLPFLRGQLERARREKAKTQSVSTRRVRAGITTEGLTKKDTAV